MKRPSARAVLFAPVLAGAVLAAALAPAQEKPRGITREVSVTAVTIAVSVKDRSGRDVTNLTARDFSVFENGAPKTINYFSYASEAPVSLTVLLDVSGSMALLDKLQECRGVLRSAVSFSLRPRDEVSLLLFADGQVEVAAPFATDKAGFQAALNAAEAYGQTALNDAVAVSPEFANRGRNEKRALVLITDGIENDSRLTPDAAAEIARRVDVPIFTIGYKIPASELLLLEYKRAGGLTQAGIVESLRKFAEATGGKAYVLGAPAELAAALREILRDLSHEYILGYTTYGDSRDEYRKITILTANKRYRVRTRQGY